MIKPNEIEAFSMAFDKQMKELEMRIMQDIVRRIKINGEITRAADWQINRLYELGMSKREIKKAIMQSLDLSDGDMLEMYKKIVGSGYARDKNTYLKRGLTQIPFEENFGLQQLISAVAEQTLGNLQNITQSLGFAVRQTDGKLGFLPIADYYQKTLDGAILDIASGAFDYNTALKRVVNEMTNSGLRTVDYATGQSNRIDVAARRAVMTGMSQLTAKVNEDNAKALGTNMFEITWHSGARPSHQAWQGKWYTREQLETVCGLGTVTGLCGANCYHDYYPVIPGISEPTYTTEQLAEMNRRENIPIEYNGKQYTKYEALQRQRRLETAMRAKRQEIKLLQDGGASEDDLMTARGRYRGLSQEYSMFSKAMDLPQQRERIYVDGLGNIGAGKFKKTVDKSAESGIISIKQVDITENDISIISKAMQSQDDVDEFLKLINGSSDSIKKAYKAYSPKLNAVKFAKKGYYQPSSKNLAYSYPASQYTANGRSKFSTLAHEYGHFIDDMGVFSNISYSEVDELNKIIGGSAPLFKRIPSSSDEFLQAMRNDKRELKSLVFDNDFRNEIFSTHASAGLQDAIDGMFGSKAKMGWHHGDKYYNRKYNNLKLINAEKSVKQAYKNLGMDVSNKTKVKSLVRNYETASEMWANIMSAETCGGLELEYIKKYLSNSYNAYIKIMKGLI